MPLNTISDLRPYTALFRTVEGTVECFLVVAADALAALGVAQARYATAADPALLDGEEDAAGWDSRGYLPGAECLAIYPGHQIDLLSGGCPRFTAPQAVARTAAAPAAACRAAAAKGAPPGGR